MRRLSHPLTRLPLTLAALVAVSLAAAPDAHAYLDPGTGSAVIQMVLAGLMGALFVLKAYGRKLKSFFSRSAEAEDPQAMPGASVAADDDE